MRDKKFLKKKKVQCHSLGLTTEKEELEFRQKRGQNEEMSVEALQQLHFPYVDYAVQSEMGIVYTVEIRSLTETINSCSCPDFCVNTLKTCKHIERVLHHLEHREKKKISEKARSGSPFVEIFLEPAENLTISIAWPKQASLLGEHKKTIASYFSANNRLIASPLPGMASMEHALSRLPSNVREKIRISSHLEARISDLKRKEACNLSREQFLEDVRLGKRSTQMLNVPLYPYQEEGMLHLAFQGRALLADDMGLGKTIQAIAACELLRRLHNIKRVVVISPASLKGEWEEQIAKFTGLPAIVVRGPRGDRLAAYQKEAFFYLTNYEQIRSDFEEIQKIIGPDVVILDEAQRIKNWQTKTAWAVKQLKTPYAFVLTGTPIENRIDEVYSIMQMIDPMILGPLFKFTRDYYQFGENNKPVGYQNLAKLHQKLKPVLLRRLKRDVEEQLPERTVNNFFVKMDEEQSIRYEEYNSKVSKLMKIMKKRPLNVDELKSLQRYLACMRMLADTPYILDENCRVCPKLEELQQILGEIMENDQNKIIIFSEWERMLVLVREMIEKEFKSDYAWHTGTVPQLKRLEDIKRFKTDPSCRFFLTTDSGSTGLNLQVANVVINLDLPWNPAKLEQRIARAWRKNQTRAVQVINFVSEGTIEHRMLTTLAQKQTLADGVLDGLGDLDAMPLPSARIQILEQLEKLFLEESESSGSNMAQPPKENALDNLKNDAIAHFNDRIHSLELHQKPASGQKTLLAVVDKLDPAIGSKLQEFVQASDAPVQLELLDQPTYSLLQRLAEAGIITIHAQAGESLYRSPAASRSFQTEKQRMLAAAKKVLAEGERKAKMMNLLVSGGFLKESLTPAKEALSLGLKCHSTLNERDDVEGDALLGKIEACDEEANRFDEIQASALLEQLNQRMQNYAETLSKFAMT